MPTLSAEELLYKFRVEEDLRFIPKILPLHKKKEEEKKEERKENEGKEGKEEK